MDGGVKNSLKVMPFIFKGFDDYRVLGSILVAALNGKPHRTLHDIDLLIDERIYEEVSSRFVKLGFKKITKKALIFKWDEFQKPNHLKFGVTIKGMFKGNFFIYNPSSSLALYIKSDYLKPTEYELFGYKIQGIPLRSVYEGIKIANLNKKRVQDKKIVLESVGKKLPEGLSINQAFQIHLLGLEIPYLYVFFSEIYNLVGGFRLLLGKSYDPWS